MTAPETGSQPKTWVIADALVEGSRRHVLIRDGRIAGFPDTIEEHLPVIDARGGRLLPGLIDHHLHLFATAAMLSSVDASQCGPGEQERFEILLRSCAAKGRVRATGYDDEIAGPLDRWRLDVLCPDVPVRVQYRTGSLWVLNSAALELALADETQAPPFVERNEQGALTGRVWRGDTWLRQKWAAAAPSLAPLGALLGRWGVTAVTDASATTDQAQAGALAAAAAGALPQRLMLMSAGPLAAPADGAFRVGPVKLLLDEHDLPPLEVVQETIRFARAEKRRVAVHCVTPAELALMLVAFEIEGAQPGDRIEHGSMIPEDMIPLLHDLGLTVVTQPAFIHARGDRYLRQVAPAEQGDLYRLASLLAAGVQVAGSSDAPYGPLNPWIGIAAATTRETASAARIGPAESLSAEQALGLYLGAADAPGGKKRTIEAGAVADLCLLRPDSVASQPNDAVALTVIAGQTVYRWDSTSIYA